MNEKDRVLILRNAIEDGDPVEASSIAKEIKELNNQYEIDTIIKTDMMQAFGKAGERFHMNKNFSEFMLTVMAFTKALLVLQPEFKPEFPRVPGVPSPEDLVKFIKNFDPGDKFKELMGKEYGIR